MKYCRDRSKINTCIYKWQSKNIDCEIVNLNWTKEAWTCFQKEPYLASTNFLAPQWTASHRSERIIIDNNKIITIIIIKIISTTTTTTMIVTESHIVEKIDQRQITLHFATCFLFSFIFIFYLPSDISYIYIYGKIYKTII